MEEWYPGAQFHLSDSHCLGNQLHGCAGVRDQRQRVVLPLMLDPAMPCWAVWARKRICVTGNASILHRWSGTDICHCRESRKHHQLRLPMHMCWQYWEQQTNVALKTVHLPPKGFKKVCKSCIAELAFPNSSARQANVIAPFHRSLKQATWMLTCNSLKHVPFGADDR